MPTPADSPLDPTVVAELYVQHGEELRRFLLGILRDAQLTSDVLQATLLVRSRVLPLLYLPRAVIWSL